MSAILTYTIAGNSVVDYLLFLGVLAVAFFGTKLVYYLFERIFKRLARKTETELDDMLVDALRGPVTFAVILGGFQYARRLLEMTESVSTIYSQILGALLVINIAWFVVRILNAFIRNYVQPLTKSKKFKMDKTIYQAIVRVVDIIIYAVAIVVILQNFGYKVTGLVAGLGIGGLAFALAAQDLLGNMFGGAAVILDKPFKVGDRVKVAGQDGFISKITLRTTTLETFGKTHVVMPNKTIADSVLENVSREDMRREKVVLGLEYDTPSQDLDKAKQLLADIIKQNDKTDDESMVHFINFGASSLDIQAIYWIKDLDNILATKDEIHMEIKRVFDAEELAFAFPTQTIHLNT